MTRNDVLFSVSGAGLLALTVILLVNTLGFIGRAQRAAGFVVRVVTSVDVEGNVTFRPIVRFLIESGEPAEFSMSAGSFPSLYGVGDRVTVLYEPGREDQAVIQSLVELWALPTIAASIGLVFLAIGLEPWWRRERLRWSGLAVPKQGRPGRWFRLVFHSGEVENVEQVLAALRDVMVDCRVERVDAAGVDHELAPGEDLTTGGRWNVLVAEDSLALARSTLRRLPCWMTIDRAGREERSFESTPLSRVVLWGMLFLTAVATLAIAIGMNKGAISVQWPSRPWLLVWGAGGMVLALGLLTRLARRGGSGWTNVAERRFLAVPLPGRDLDGVGRDESFD